MKCNCRRVFALAVVLLSGCVAPGLIAQETVGERFRKVLAEIDAECKRDKLGPYLDPADPEYMRKRRGTDCDILRLEPRDWRTEKMVRTDGQHYPIPERWLATPEGRFAHSIKLPSPYDRPKAVYRSDMGGQAYFEALCREEAGEFVLRSVADVRALRQDRPWIPWPAAYSNLVFWVQEKGAPFAAKPQDHLIQPPWGRYRELEVRLTDREARTKNAPLVVFSRNAGNATRAPFGARTDDGRYVTVPYEVATSYRGVSTVRYAYTWRGVLPEGGWEHGIEGFELIVFQAAPLEVLGFQRNYWRHVPDDARPGSGRAHTDHCQKTKDIRIPRFFLHAVLMPASES